MCRECEVHLFGVAVRVGADLFPGPFSASSKCGHHHVASAACYRLHEQAALADQPSVVHNLRHEGCAPVERPVEGGVGCRMSREGRLDGNDQRGARTAV